MTAMSSLNRLGLLGGMSWQSSAQYYRLLNEMVQQRVGGHTSAPLVLWSVDFAEIQTLQQAGDWPAQGQLLAEAALALQGAGVTAIALATNTLHLVADQITANLQVPFVDLVDVVGKACSAAGYRTVGILATGYTMGSDLFASRLAGYGVDVLVPPAPDRELVHGIIYDELVHGVFTDASRAAYLAVTERLVAAGAEAVVLACTEIGLLLQDGDASVALLDTTILHCRVLTDVICGEQP